MKNKSLLAVLLVFMLVFSSIAVYADENGTEAEPVLEEEAEMEEEAEVAEEAEVEEEMEDEADAEEALMDEATVIVLVLGQNTAMVNGEEKELEAAPFADENNRTLVPLRFVGEALGAEIGWNAEDKAVTYTKGDIEIVLHIGMAHAMVNGEEVELNTAPVISNGRTMVPVRFISETLGYNVDWDGVTRTVTITDQVMEDEAIEEEAVEVEEEELEEEAAEEEEEETEETAEQENGEANGNGDSEE